MSRLLLWSSPSDLRSHLAEGDGPAVGERLPGTNTLPPTRRSWRPVGMLNVAELRASGVTHLRVNCAACRALSCTPWQLMPGAPDGLELEDVRRRLRCSRCQQRPAPEDVSPWSQHMASGYQMSFQGGGYQKHGAGGRRFVG